MFPNVRRSTVKEDMGHGQNVDKVCLFGKPTYYRDDIVYSGY
jgi:hypothetical protein